MRGRRRWIVAGIVVVVLAVLALWPGLPGRRLIADYRTSACHETSNEGAAVALGDSITDGFTDQAWGFQAANSWFGQLVCADGSPVAYGYNAGVWQQTTEQMLGRLDADVLARDPGQVFLLGGTNDLTAGVPLDVTVNHLREMAKRSRSGGADVFLGTIPPREDPEFTERTAALNEAITALGTELGLTVLDFHAALVDGDGTYRDGLNQDELHPSEAGARAMADVAAAALR